MKYSDFAIEQLLNQLAELFNNKSTPKKTAGLALEAIEVIRQLRNAAAPPRAGESDQCQKPAAPPQAGGGNQ